MKRENPDLFGAASNERDVGIARTKSRDNAREQDSRLSFEGRLTRGLLNSVGNPRFALHSGMANPYSQLQATPLLICGSQTVPVCSKC